MLKNVIRIFGDVTSHKPIGIPRVVDKLVWINVIDPDGLKHVIAGYVGESMLMTIEKHKIDIPASCRGGDLHIPETEDPVDPLRYGPTCSECQIEVGEPWIHYLKPMGVWENERLVKTASGYFTRFSRLACCFTVEKWMNGMEIVIPFNVREKMEFDEIAFPRGENRILYD